MLRVRVADDAEDLVALVEEQLGQIRAVLARDSRDEGPFGHRLSLLRLATAADDQVDRMVTASEPATFAYVRYFSSQSALSLNARNSFERRVNPCPSSSKTSYSTSRPRLCRRSTI